MPELKRIRRRRRRTPAGDLQTRVQLMHRTQNAVGYDEAHAAFAFSAILGDGYVWAMVETLTGRTLFDAVAGDQRISHRVVIRSLVGVTSESWVLLPTGERLAVVAVDGWDERGEFMELLCDARGSSTRDASGL